LEQQEQSGVWLTVERAGYIALGLLAAVLRLAQLGLRPFHQAEAIQALAAFRFVQGEAQAAPTTTVPALFTGNVLGFTLMGASDASARWLPALAGIAIVLLPYWLRRRLGRTGALATSFLLAISPSMVYFSRNLDSAIVVAACSLVMVTGLVNYVDTRRPGHLYLFAVAAGLGLCAGPGIYSQLWIWVAFALVLFLSAKLLNRSAGWSTLQLAWASMQREPGLTAKAGAALIAVFALVATTFVLRPGGVGHAADLVAAWARSFVPESGGQPWFYPLLLLLRYEPFILILGLVQAGRWLAGQQLRQAGAARDDLKFPFAAFLLFWTVLAIFFMLIVGQRSPGNALWGLLPLALLAGRGVDRVWRGLRGHDVWPETAWMALAGLGLGVFLYLQIVAYGLTSDTATVTFAGITIYETTAFLLLAAVALLLLIVLVVGTWAWRGSKVVLAGAWLAVVIALGLFGFKAMWGVSFAHTSDARELMIVEATAPDVRLLVESLEALSLDQSGDAHTLSVTIDSDTGPVVAWYLRDFDQLTMVDNLTTPPDTLAAVTLSAQDLPIGETFRGQGFPMRTRWLPGSLSGKALVRWLLFTEGSQPLVDQEVVLWVASAH
jgi:uncharacterized protein (TIGR03663 family)